MSAAPRRALFVHSSNEMYGADIILLGLLEGRDSSRWSPSVILPNDVPYQGRLAAKLGGISVPYRELKLAVLRRRYFTPHRFGLYCAYFAWSTASIARQILREKIDVVHSNTTAVIPGAIAAKLTRRPHVWHSHEMVVSPGFVRKLTARMAPALSDVVVTVSGAVREHMLSDNPAARNIRVLHNGIDVERFASASGRERVRAEFGFAPDDVVIGTLGRVSRGKGQGYLLDAAARIAAARIAGDAPGVKYLLVGDAFVGQEHLVDELRRKVDELGLAELVRLSGYRADGPDVLAALDICVLPSTLPDSFPTIVLEAMAAGKPVVATNWGGAKEMIVEGETGFVVPVDDAAVLADRLKTLASSEELRRSFGAAGQARARELFTRQRMCSEFWAIMDEVAASRGAVRLRAAPR